MNILPFLIHCPFLIIWVLLLKRKYHQEPLVSFFTLGFISKILAGIVYGWLYIIYYGGIGDSLNYYKDGSILAQFAFKNPQGYLDLLFFDKYFTFNDFTNDWWMQPRAFLMIKLISILNILCFDNYWIISFYLSFFSFWGMWKLANSLTKLFPHTQYAAIIAFLLFPSILLWSAGLTKESLALGLIGFSVSKMIDLIDQPTQNWFFWLKSGFIWFISLILLWGIKFYYLASLLPCVSSFFITVYFLQKLSQTSLQGYFKGIILQSFLMLIVLIVSALLATQLHYTLNLKYFLYAIVYNHNSTYIFSEPNDLIHYSIYPQQGYITLDATIGSMLYNAPWALFSALYRPFIWEAGANKLKFLLSLEGSAVIILTMYAIYYYLRNPPREVEFVKKKQLLLLACLIYITILLTLLALSSPNLGSLARYRVAAYMFYIYLIISPLNELLKKLFQKMLFWKSSKV